MTDINGSLNVVGDVDSGGVFKNFKPESMAIDPTMEELTSPRIWFNTNAKTLKYFDGETILSLGSLTVDQLNSALSDYATKTDLVGFVSGPQLAEELSAYVLTSAMTELLAPYAKLAEVITREAQAASFYNVITETAQQHTIVHNLGYEFPVIQCFNTANGALVSPDLLQSIDENTLFIQVRTPMMLNVNVIWTKPPGTF